ncbi:hypothetical protein HG535_0A06640 [Zygotorulaspora mrakii]|uniref:Uncharacterized protein n=1 Tax=Zygotorulaspora mrakii TaxID=42260 RepID=A0A7H9AYS1_ZYGMR|nr:uncharacterized protein HG535_0A06640 [Zygotorulaspora mrakii]QLG70722.1 hypothetical protein HG535_0A06640 [Zygotorulaspora mrakii]
METRSKSFQNCTEAEIPGYNDCPSFLFQVNKAAAKTGRRNQIVTEVRDVSGNTKASTLPPPPLASRRSRRNLPIESEKSEPDLSTLSYEEVLSRVESLCSFKSRLPTQEFDFYRRKIKTNMTKNLEIESVRQVLTMVFEESSDKHKGQLVLREWLTSDTSISNWCPAFLKIYENAIEDDL